MRTSMSTEPDALTARAAGGYGGLGRLRALPICAKRLPFTVKTWVGSFVFSSAAGKLNRTHVRALSGRLPGSAGSNLERLAASLAAFLIATTSERVTCEQT